MHIEQTWRRDFHKLVCEINVLVVAKSSFIIWRFTINWFISSYYCLIVFVAFVVEFVSSSDLAGNLLPVKIDSLYIYKIQWINNWLKLLLSLGQFKLNHWGSQVNSLTMSFVLLGMHETKQYQEREYQQYVFHTTTDCFLKQNHKLGCFPECYTITACTAIQMPV